MAATKEKTIEYMLPMITSNLAIGTSYTDTADITVNIPENTSRAFLSVMLEVVWHDNVFTNNSDPTAWGIRGSCDAGTNWTSATTTTGGVESDENVPQRVVVDMTAEFTARFGSGASGTFRAGFYCNYDAAGPTLTNVSFKLIITYEYDESAHTTCIKTVRIPIESFSGRLSSTAQVIGQASTATDQLPALLHASTPFLPEASATIRQAFCELWTNTMSSAATSTALRLKVDSGGGETTYGTTGTATPGIPMRILYDVTSVDWTAAHSLYARHDQAAQSHFAHIGGLLVVTYEYNKSTSSTILNSVMGCIPIMADYVKASGDNVATGFKFPVTEPATVTLKQSGVFLMVNTTTSSTTLNLKIGAQSAHTGYTPTTITGAAGQIFVMQRFDSGANGGAGITSFGRGVMEISINVYGSTTNNLCVYGIRFYLNYTSGKAADGAEFHSRSVAFLAKAAANSAGTVELWDFVSNPKIISSVYTILNAFTDVCQNLAQFPTTNSGGLSMLQVERQSGEGLGAGWEPVSADFGPALGERCFWWSTSNMTEILRLWPGYPDTYKLDIEKTSRRATFISIGSQLSIIVWITYHDMNFTFSAALSGYTGNPSGVTIELFRSDNHEYVGFVTSDSSGNFSGSLPYDFTTFYAKCRQDSTHVGASDNSTPT